MTSDDVLIGWDVGGAHVKASCWRAGRLVDVRQWACPLWQGLSHLDGVLDAATQAWGPLPAARHAVTMSGEMTDLFAHREDGVRQIAAHLLARCGDHLRLYAGPAGWVGADEAAAQWAAIASANWRATAACSSKRLGTEGAEGLLVDIGSTTTDLIALRGGAVCSLGHTDADRLVSGELVYHGVVRTPLCAVASRIPFDGRLHRVMNEFFATTADVYRLLGQLDPAHDLYPAADNGPRDADGSCRRLARMIGLDGREASLEAWRDMARAWSDAQLAEIEAAAREVIAATGLAPGAAVISAGCGDFLAAALARRLGRPCRRFADLLLGPQADEALAAWVQVGAPSVAVGALALASTGG